MTSFEMLFKSEIYSQNAREQNSFLIFCLLPLALGVNLDYRKCLGEKYIISNSLPSSGDFSMDTHLFAVL